MNPELEKRINHLDSLTELHLKFSKRMLEADQGKIFPLDIMALATIKRSLSLIQAFTALVKAKNYAVSASLLRLQLDSCLRFYAAFIVDEPHQLAHNVLKGEPIRKMKDKDGNRMTDRYLVNSLSQKYEWIPRVYESTSGFIHLSEKHLFSVFDPSYEDRSFAIEIRSDDLKTPIELWIEAADGFLAITDALFEHIDGWIRTKDNPCLDRSSDINKQPL